jgi:hypothetical protein
MQEERLPFALWLPSSIERFANGSWQRLYEPALTWREFNEQRLSGCLRVLDPNRRPRMFTF